MGPREHPAQVVQRGQAPICHLEASVSKKCHFPLENHCFLTVKHTFEHLPVNRFLNFLVPFLSPGILHKVLPFVRGSANFHFFLRCNPMQQDFY